MPKKVSCGALAALAGVLVLLAAGRAVAEPQEIRIAKQYGLGFLPLIIMQEEGLFEKRAAQQGLHSKAEWVTLGGPAAANEALLSGSVDIIANGPPAFLIMWARTHGTSLEVKGVAPLVSLPMYLNTSDPRLKSISDFTDRDRIAVSSVKTSIPAIILEIAAANKWGADEFAKFDPLTVSLPHPDGMSALLSGAAQITADFTSPPYQEVELENKSIHRVTTSDEIMGGPSTFSLMFTTSRFHDRNPKTYKAFLEALGDAQVFIGDHREQAADIYMKRAREGGASRELILKILAEPSVVFDLKPRKIMQYAAFLNRIGMIGKVPGSVNEAFFSDIGGQGGD